MIRVHRKLRYVPYAHTCLRSALCSSQILSSSLLLCAHSNMYILSRNDRVICSTAKLNPPVEVPESIFDIHAKYLLSSMELGHTTCLRTSTSVDRRKIRSYRSSKGNVFSQSKLSEEPSQSDLSLQIAINPHPEFYLEFLAESEALAGCGMGALALRTCQAVVYITRIYLPKGQCSRMSHCHQRSD